MSDLSLWGKYKVGLHFEWTFSFSRENMKIFSKLSKDNNPIHNDTSFAKSKGFHAPLVHGMLLSSQVSRLIGKELPDNNSIFTGVQMNFIKPCFPDDELIFSSNLINKSDSTYALEFDCKILRKLEILCRGKVEAIWKP